MNYHGYKTNSPQGCKDMRAKAYSPSFTRSETVKQAPPHVFYIKNGTHISM